MKFRYRCTKQKITSSRIQWLAIIDKNFFVGYQFVNTTALANGLQISDLSSDSGN